MRTGAIMAAIVAVQLGASGAAALECLQSKAIYQADEGLYRLSFHPVPEQAATITHLFSLSEGGLTLDGMVMQTEEPLRTIARIEKNCPEGDVTGDDIRACTIYEGYLYGIDDAGHASNLLSGGKQAAPRLLLAGLGPSMASSPLAAKSTLPLAPDTFHLAECAP